MAVTDVLNFILLEDGTGLAGQPRAEHFGLLRDEGYGAVINLLPPDAPHALAGEAALVANLGLAYHAIPVLWLQPERADHDRFVAIMAELGGTRSFIHCAANYRVTAFYALYAQQKLGWSEARADALMDRVWKARPDFVMGDGWKSLIADIRADLPAVQA